MKIHSSISRDADRQCSQVWGYLIPRLHFGRAQYQIYHVRDEEHEKRYPENVPPFQQCPLKSEFDNMRDNSDVYVFIWNTLCCSINVSLCRTARGPDFFLFIAN